MRASRGPLFVTAGTALNVARIQYRRQDLIADEVRSLERKQERDRRRELGQKPDDSRSQPQGDASHPSGRSRFGSLETTNR